MDTLRSVSHLQKELGDDLFNVLVSSDNTRAVRKFAKKLADSAFPTVITLAGRTYDIISFLKEKETSVVGHTMVDRAKRMGANLGKEDGEWFLYKQEEIPVAFRGKVAFVFADWRDPVNSEDVAFVYWGDAASRWFLGFGYIGRGWIVSDRLPRRRS